MIREFLEQHHRETLECEYDGSYREFVFDHIKTTKGDGDLAQVREYMKKNKRRYDDHDRTYDINKIENVRVKPVV